MKSETFIDTSAFYALLAKGDDAHARTTDYIKNAARASERFVTSDYVLDETATLLKMRVNSPLAGQFLSNIASSKSCRIVWMDADFFDITTNFFIRHGDHDWSFTDCFSFVIMRKLKIHTALTKDHHFQAAGFNTPLLK